MKYNRTIIFILIIGLIFSSVAVNIDTINADDENAQDNVDTEFRITINSPTYFLINATTIVEHITLPGSGKTYNTSQIESGSAPLEAIKGRIHEVINETIRNTFPGCKINPNQDLPAYTNGSFNSDFFITVTTEFFSMNEKADLAKMLKGMLNMGADIVYDFNLYATNGWQNTFEFFSESEYTIISSSRKKTVDGNIQNENNKKIKITNMSKSSSLEEKITFDFKIDSTQNKRNSLEITMTIKSIAISIYNLPDYVDKLSFITADGIRLFIENKFNNFTWSNIKTTTINPLIKDTSSIIENSSLNQTLNLEFEWDTNSTEVSPGYDLNNMDSQPPIKTTFIDDYVNLSICNISDKAFYGIINSGGKVNLNSEDINFGDGLNKLSYEYENSILFPKNMTLSNQNPFTWKQSEDFNGNFESKDAKDYNKENKETVIEIDLQNPRLNVLSFITGNTELEFDAIVTESRKYYVSNISNESEYFPIPEKISLDYLCADAFRLCVNENVFSDENMTSFLQNEKNIFKQRTNDLWPGLKIGKQAKIDKTTFEKSLNSEEVNIFDMDEYPAINVDSNAKIVKPINFDLGLLPPSFKIEKQTFKIESLEDQNITYRIIFPDGINVKVRNSLIKDADIQKTKDGRTIIEFSFNSSEGGLPANLIDCELETSGVFILGMFLPCILTFIVAIILVLVIIFVKRKKGGRFRDLIPRRSKKEKFEEDSYEDEEFYVPPPPEGKK